ncbi:dinuclear metal center YbgI/SA1388 family protein [Antricoccus suffuscus]|uniref:GTP cyclohydrolase 1 type 2 homolog n=1 Tax=Antricoccus suffuscus TaxID=1629062 RepID=A0A2T0ZY72_9ACTN|nr:Nif3-like dinuclear metal center hexameric protein [Antricoccus suffuscus]PRZ41306.1 dinuclear metal center YbgI/SA1388 family protein [Antricoccus suffuscus]
MADSTVGEIVDFFEQCYPPELAESWDAVGLACGDRTAPVGRVLFALDPTDAIVDEAIEYGADLIVTHHPLMLRGVHAVAADTPKGRIVHRLIKADCALFSAHTNADRAREGVNDALAGALGLRDTRPLVPAEGARLEKLVTFVPRAVADSVIDALASAGAGALGDYSRCAFISTGVGTFLPGAQAHPAIGERGRVETVDETRVEMVYRSGIRADVVAALRTAHPYEEPAFDLLAMVPLPDDRGLGRVGALDQPMTLAEFARRVAGALPRSKAGIRTAGDLNTTIRTVAVLGGAGDSHLDDARRAGADVFVTADLRHHVVSEHLAAGGPALIDGGHWSTEWPWLPVAERLLAQVFPQLATQVSTLCTDPWAACD